MKANEELTQEEFDSLNWVKDKSLATDWIVVWKPKGKYMKYCKVMYSPFLNSLRGCDIAEFYGNGIVD